MRIFFSLLLVVWAVLPLRGAGAISYRYIASYSGRPEGQVDAAKGTLLIDELDAELYIKTTAAGLRTGWQLISGSSGSGSAAVSDAAYDATTWNGSLNPPTQNAVRDKIEALVIPAMNPTDGRYPVRVGASGFGDGAFYKVNASDVGYTGALYSFGLDSGGNYERGAMQHYGNASGWVFDSQAAGTGSFRDYVFQIGGTNFSRFSFDNLGIPHMRVYKPNDASKYVELSVNTGGNALLDSGNGFLYISPITVAGDIQPNAANRRLGLNGSAQGWSELWMGNGGSVYYDGTGIGTVNYERGQVKHNGSAAGWVFDSQSGGSGTVRDINFAFNGTTRMNVTPSGSVTIYRNSTTDWLWFNPGMFVNGNADFELAVPGGSSFPEVAFYPSAANNNFRFSTSSATSGTLFEWQNNHSTVAAVSADGTVQPSRVQYYGTQVYDLVGTGSPEGVATASRGSTYRRIDGGAGTTFYVKESGTGNTGWVAK